MPSQALAPAGQRQAMFSPSQAVSSLQRRQRTTAPCLRRIGGMRVRAAAPSAPPKPSRGASGLDVQGLRPTSPAAWRIVSETLRTQKVRMISPQELFFTTNKEVPVIDIRPPKDFADAHIQGSTNIPLYRPITGWDPRRIARRAGFAFFGVLNGTEVNPNFFNDILGSIDNEVGAVLLCNMGGTLEPSKANGAGMQSRSLMAAYEAVQLGARKISVLKGGFRKWRRSGRPYINKEGEEVREDPVDEEEE